MKRGKQIKKSKLTQTHAYTHARHAAKQFGYTYSWNKTFVYLTKRKIIYRGVKHQQEIGVKKSKQEVSKQTHNSVSKK